MSKSKQQRLEKLFGGVMGVTVHTAFRKGSDDPSTAIIWKQISAMPPKAWDEVVEWMCWALAVSLEDALEIITDKQP